MTTSTLAVGRFGYSPTETRWTWSDCMFALHGMSPGDVVPTRALFLSHVHPGDRDRVAATLDEIATGGQPVGCDYRLVDLSGHTRDVVLALTPVSAEVGATVWGVLVDDSERQRRTVAEAVNTELTTALESHAAIDQAKGMLMLVYGIDDDAAFEILRWASQQSNVRLRVLAGRLVEAARAAGGADAVLRSTVDDLVIAAMRDVELPLQTVAHPEFGCALERRAWTPVLRVSGTVDVTSMAQLHHALGRLMAEAEDRDVVVDLRGVDHLGPVASFVLAAAQRRARARNVTMQVLVPSRAGLVHDDRSAPAAAELAARS